MQQSENWNQKPTNFKFYWFSNEVIAILSIEKHKAKTCVGRRCRLYVFFQPHTNQPTTYNHPINQAPIINQIRQQLYAVLLDLESSSVQSKCTGATTSFVFSPNKKPPNWGSQGGQSKHKAAHITYYLFTYYHLLLHIFMSIWQTRQETYKFHLI